MWKILIFSNLSWETWSRKEGTLGKSIVHKTLECWDIVDVHHHKRYLEIQETCRFFLESEIEVLVAFGKGKRG